jgi:hypothetical protein
MEALSSPEILVFTGATRYYIREDDILHSHRCENLKSYIALTGWSFSEELMCLLWGRNWVLYRRRRHST